MALKGKTITVVGAGPSGLIAATVLAQAGRKVRVVEANAGVGRRFNNDYQGFENWSRDEDARTWIRSLGIETNFILDPFYKGEVSHQKITRTIQSEKPLYYLVRRGPGKGSLDQGLLKNAKSAGVQFRFNYRLKNIKGPAIIATGPRVADIIAKGIVFKTNYPDVAQVFLGDDLAPAGYTYLLVHKGQGTIATTIFKDFHRQREVFLNSVKAAKEAHPNMTVTAPREFGGYGNTFLDQPLEENGKLFVGEAAGMQDALFGFGIRTALLSGVIAAQSILKSQNYSERIHKEIRPWVESSLFNRYRFEKGGELAYRIIAKNLSSNTNPRAWMRGLYDPGNAKRALIWAMGPWIRAWSKHQNRSCHMEDCSCTWCKHGKMETKQKKR